MEIGKPERVLVIEPLESPLPPRAGLPQEVEDEPREARPLLEEKRVARCREEDEAGVRRA